MIKRPKTIVILAMTADGKIADKARSPARFSSTTDKAHLEKQISLVDGVLFGASTLRAYKTTLPISNPDLLSARKHLQQPSQPVHIVCSASAQLTPQWRFFNQPVPRWLLTSTTGAQFWQERASFVLRPSKDKETRRQGDKEDWEVNKRGFDRILIAESQNNSSKIDWINALAQLKELGLQTLAILGGGELVASLLEIDAIDEFWLTVCPVILGGATAPTPVAGIGFTTQQARRLKLLSLQEIEGEIFLHYSLQR
ncbi:MAG: RibD family protein [Hydrococcus sp. Prado102]|jgi:5-amino-6-(5-phosphoribosylamino)uracil reductase|nr:RibD family protein [Hydrococcus sp. Prado102]